MTTIGSSALTQPLQQRPLGQVGGASQRDVSASARSASDFAKIFEALNAEQDGKTSPAELAAPAAPAPSPWETVRTGGDSTPAAAASAREFGGSRPQASAEPSLMDMTQTLSTRLMAQILGNMDPVAA
jgi:hypothetical protein